MVLEATHGPVSWWAGQCDHMAQRTAPMVTFSCFWVAWHLENPLALWGTLQLVEWSLFKEPPLRLQKGQGWQAALSIGRSPLLEDSW